jgi:2Fe-2S ferredoxin
MPEVHFLPDDKRIQVRPGTTLLDAGRKAHVNIRTRCGGKAACLMCKVKAGGGGGLAAATRNEELKLGSLLADGFRLACQACVIGNVTVEVPEDPLKAAVRAQLQRQREEEW